MLEIGGNRKFLEFIQLYMMQNSDLDRHSKYFKRACGVYRERLQKAAEEDIDFVVDSSWFDELPLTEGHQMLQQNNNSHMQKDIKRRYESQREPSTMKEAENIGKYVSENIKKIPNCVEQTACREPPCTTKFNWFSCGTAKIVNKDSQANLS